MTEMIGFLINTINDLYAIFPTALYTQTHTVSGRRPPSCLGGLGESTYSRELSCWGIKHTHTFTLPDTHLHSHTACKSLRVPIYFIPLYEVCSSVTLNYSEMSINKSPRTKTLHCLFLQRDRRHFSCLTAINSSSFFIWCFYKGAKLLWAL